MSEQRRQQFEDLMQSLRLLQVNNHQIPKPQLYAFMRALEAGNLKINYQHQVRDHSVLYQLTTQTKVILDLLFLAGKSG